MDLFDEKIDELLAKHLAGECTPEEEEALRIWLEESPEHQKHLADLRWLWERSAEGLSPAPRAVDTEAALQKVKTQIGKPSSGFSLGWQRGFLMRAAAVLILAVAAVYWWQDTTQSKPQEIVAGDIPVTKTLTDGSVVELQEASELKIAANFNRRERRMQLKGKANFEVAPDTVRPFVVAVGDLQVQVVGTVFTVDNKTNPEKVLVEVSEGKVLVSLSGQSILLVAGEKASYDTQDGSLSRIAPEQGIPAEKNRIFRFDSTPLSLVVEQMSKAYGVQISIKNEQLKNCPLTADYNNLPLERVLNLVVETFSIEIEKEGDNYILIGDACEE